MSFVGFPDRGFLRDTEIMQPSHRTGSPDSQSNQDAEERALYLQFCDTLQSLLDLVDRFETISPKIQRKLQETYPILETWDDSGRQDLRMRLQAMLEGLEEQVDSLPPPWAG
jgi:hypothetical protein